MDVILYMVKVELIRYIKCLSPPNDICDDAKMDDELGLLVCGAQDITCIHSEVKYK